LYSLYYIVYEAEYYVLDQVRLLVSPESVEIFANWRGGDVVVKIMKYFLIICNLNNCKHEDCLLSL